MRVPTDLVEAARAGRPDAVLGLLAHCQPDLQRFARRTCSTTEDAEDAVQFALWQLYRRIGALRTVAALAGWLFRIVERQCIRIFKGRLPAESLDDLPESEMPAAAGTALAGDLRSDLGRAIARLSRPYRDVLILRDVHELTAPEVALELGISVAAVKSRLHRARASVRAELQAGGYALGA